MKSCKRYQKIIKIIIGVCRERKTKESKGWSFGERIEARGRIFEFAEVYDLDIVNTFLKKINEHIRIYKNGGNTLQVYCLIVRKKMLK